MKNNCELLMNAIFEYKTLTNLTYTAITSNFQSKSKILSLAFISNFLAISFSSG